MTMSVYKLEDVHVRCEMCGKAVCIQRVDTDGEFSTTSSGRNMILMQDLAGKSTYSYVCDGCLDGEDDVRSL